VGGGGGGWGVVGWEGGGGEKKKEVKEGDDVSFCIIYNGMMRFAHANACMIVQ